MAIQKEHMEGIYHLCFRVDRREIWYLQFIVESYEGLATVSTLNPEEGIVEIKTPISRIDDIAKLLHELRREIDLQEIAENTDMNYMEVVRGRETDAQLHV